MVGGERAYLGLNGWYPSFTASSALTRDHLSRRLVLLSQNLTHQKQVGEQRTEMDGSVQIVNQLGAGGGGIRNTTPHSTTSTPRQSSVMKGSTMAFIGKLLRANPRAPSGRWWQRPLPRAMPKAKMALQLLTAVTITAS